MTDRVACMVPGCRRTTGAAYSEWLCSKHYPSVDRELKLLRRRMRRRHGPSYRGWKIDGWIWRRMVAQAIERAAGI